MTFTLRQAFSGFIVLAALSPTVLAVMPPYTSDPGTSGSSYAKQDDKSQGIPNSEVIQALKENQKLLRELLQRLDQGALQTASVPNKK